jgi:hypothetical protein
MSQAYPVALVKLTVGRKVFAFVMQPYPLELAREREAGYVKRAVSSMEPVRGGESHIHWDRLQPITQLAIEACENSLESFLWVAHNMRGALVQSGAFRHLSDEELARGARQAHIIDHSYWGMLLRNRDNAFGEEVVQRAPVCYSEHFFTMSKVKLQAVITRSEGGLILAMNKMKVLVESEGSSEDENFEAVGSEPDGELHH